VTGRLGTLRVMSDEHPSEAGEPALRLAKVWSLRTVVAAAITSVALSGIGGAALAAASNGSDEGGRSGPGGFGRPGQVPGQLPGQVGQRPGQVRSGQGNGQVPPGAGGATSAGAGPSTTRET
jgi:hypothetical protein